MFDNLEYAPEHRVVLIVGNYGSGKTEVAVNLAIQLVRRQRVSIADLDIVNPYFRCREARVEMEGHGIHVINPEGDYQAADLPIILPELRGAVLSGEGILIFDVGGDDVGARVLSSLADVLGDRPCTMLQVLNAKRPFTDTVEGCLKIGREIEAASRLSITGLISNTHLLEETDVSTVLEGLQLASAVQRESGLPLAFATARHLQPQPQVFHYARFHYLMTTHATVVVGFEEEELAEGKARPGLLESLQQPQGGQAQEEKINHGYHYPLGKGDRTLHGKTGEQGQPVAVGIY